MDPRLRGGFAFFGKHLLKQYTPKFLREPFVTSAGTTSEIPAQAGIQTRHSKEPAALYSQKPPLHRHFRAGGSNGIRVLIPQHKPELNRHSGEGGNDESIAETACTV